MQDHVISENIIKNFEFLYNRDLVRVRVNFLFVEFLKCLESCKVDLSKINYDNDDLKNLFSALDQYQNKYHELKKFLYQRVTKKESDPIEDIILNTTEDNKLFYKEILNIFNKKQDKKRSDFNSIDSFIRQCKNNCVSSKISIY